MNKTPEGEKSNNQTIVFYFSPKIRWNYLGALDLRVEGRGSTCLVVFVKLTRVVHHVSAHANTSTNTRACVYYSFITGSGGKKRPLQTRGHFKCRQSTVLNIVITPVRAYLVGARGRQLGLRAGEGSLPLLHIWNSCAAPALFQSSQGLK